MRDLVRQSVMEIAVGGVERAFRNFSWATGPAIRIKCQTTTLRDFADETNYADESAPVPLQVQAITGWKLD